jgi:tetratricopeptide (TPR) repeat protein/DNA-binding CsgD family transcriptional regulator
MRKLLLTLVLLLPFLSNGQESTFNYKAAESKIKKYIYSNPDSTKVIIDYVLAQKNLPDSIRGTVYNIYGIYYGNIGKTDSSLYYYKKAIASLKNYPAIRSMPLLNISVAYRNRGEYDESFKNLEDALEINRKMGDKIGQAFVYSNMSSNYQFMLEYGKSIECLLKARELVKNDPNEVLHMTNINQKLANTYMKMRNFTFAKDLYTDCLAKFKATHDDVNHALTLINYAECVMHMNEITNAKKALKEAIKELDAIKNAEHLAVAYSKLANIANHEKKYEVARQNYEAAQKIFLKVNSLNLVIIGAEYVEFLNSLKKYHEALPVIETVKNAPIYKNTNVEDRMRFGLAAAETYKNTDNDKEAIKGLTTAIKLKDSLAALDNIAYTKELQAKYQHELQREKKIALKAKNDALVKAVDNERTLMVFYSIISLTVIVLVLLFLRSYWLKNHLQKEALKSVEAEKSLMQQRHLHEQEITNTQKQQIEEKQRELTSTALRMANYQNHINDIIDKCDNESFTNVTDIKRELQHLMKQKDYWKQFETRFNSLHPEFGNNLISRYSKLTKSDVEFCSLLKLNLSNKEISSLLQISYESTLTKKYRIKKKMEIHDDAEFGKLLMEI